MAKVLLIEDDSQMVTLYKGLFEDEKYKVLIANDGTQGLHKARDHKPDIIILDIMLPGGINGFDVLEELKRDNELKDIPVLVLTNLDSEEKVAKQIGAEGYIVKAHSDPKEVVNEVKKLI